LSQKERWKETTGGRKSICRGTITNERRCGAKFHSLKKEERGRNLERGDEGQCFEKNSCRGRRGQYFCNFVRGKDGGGGNLGRNIKKVGKSGRIKRKGGGRRASPRLTQKKKVLSEGRQWNFFKSGKKKKDTVAVDEKGGGKTVANGEGEGAVRLRGECSSREKGVFS